MITPEQLQQHASWCRGDGGKRIEFLDANLSGANLRGANLRDVDLRGANLSGANLHDVDLRGANLRQADLHDVDLRGANLSGANLHDVDLRGANLRGADLRGAIGNMREIKSAQFDTWAVTWSADVLAIGCQQHAIEKWRTADLRWIAAMDSNATEWWSRYGALVLQLIDASPATRVVLEAQP